jgi:hypothetical protein
MAEALRRSVSAAPETPAHPLQDVGFYITKLPKTEHATAEWEAAMESLLLVVELGDPTMFARIGVMRALNRSAVLQFNRR